MSSYWELTTGHSYAVTIVEVTFFSLLSLVLGILTLTGTVVFLGEEGVVKGVGVFLVGTLLTFLSFCAAVYFNQFL